MPAFWSERVVKDDDEIYGILTPHGPRSRSGMCRQNKVFIDLNAVRHKVHQIKVKELFLSIHDKLCAFSLSITT